MTELEILNEILTIFYGTIPRHRAFDIIGIQNLLLGKNPSLSQGWSKDLTEEFVAKLIRDKFVRYDTDNISEVPRFIEETKYYKITIDGIIFIKDGGYVKQSETKRLDEKATKDRIRSEKTYQGWIVTGFYYLKSLLGWFWNHIINCH
jgi:hypothetical protein